MAAASIDEHTTPDAEDEGWSDEEIESMLATAILIGIVTVILYFVVLRPIFNPKNNDGVAAGGQQQRQQQQRGERNANEARQRQAAAAAAAAIPGRAQTGRRAAAAGAGSASSASLLPSIVAGGNRRPSHLADGCTSGPLASGYLVEGLVPFRRSKAGTYETQMQQQTSNDKDNDGDMQDVVAANRRSRARLFARLLNPSITGSKTTTPPPRGSNIIVCIPSTDVSCSKLHRALWLLGTYFNLFLVICLPQIAEDEVGKVDESERERDLMSSLRKQLRPIGTNSEEGGVPTDVLPDHRIVAARSVEGRVAFVRQMHRPEFVLDGDAEMKAQLERFGFTVLLYGQRDEHKGSSIDGVSSLGKTLMS